MHVHCTLLIQVRPTPKVNTDKVYGNGVEDLRFEKHMANLTKFFRVAKMYCLKDLTISIVMPYKNGPDYKNIHEPFINAIGQFISNYGANVKTLDINIDGNFA